MTRTPFFALTYAIECERLLDDFHVTPELRLDAFDLLSDISAHAQRAVHGPTPQIDWSQIEFMGRKINGKAKRAAQQITA